MIDYSKPNGPIQQDAQGRSFIIMGTGEKKYISPAAMHQPEPSYTGGVFHSRPTFNQNSGNYESGLDWGNILSLVVAGVMTAGVADALMGASAGTTQAMIDSGAAGSGGGGGAAGVGVQSGLLGPSMESAADVYGAGAGGAAGAGGSSWPSWLSPALKLGVPAAFGLANHFGGSGSGSGSGTGTNGLDPSMQANVNSLLSMVTHRLQSTQPIHDAAMAMAGRMAPTGGDNPRLNAAIDRTAQPQSPQSSLNPQVTEAIRRLMGGG